MRWSVYRSDDFLRGDELGPGAPLTEAEWLDAYADEDGDFDEVELDSWRGMRIVPTDPDTAAQSQPYSGTHSILDITNGVSATPQPFTVSALTDDQLLGLFGTITPTGEQVAAATWDICEHRERWYGAYVVSFDAGKPTEIHFMGFSGD